HCARAGRRRPRGRPRAPLRAPHLHRHAVPARAARAARRGANLVELSSAPREDAGPPDAVVWHDLECGTYRADLPLWRELARDAGVGPILEIGAGSGRVSLDLA